MYVIYVGKILATPFYKMLELSSRKLCMGFNHKVLISTLFEFMLFLYTILQVFQERYLHVKTVLISCYIF